MITIHDNMIHSFEPQGSKEKYWVMMENNQKALFKIPRNGTGEHWSEIIACKVAQLLCLPHAEYYLAQHNDKIGVLSPSFVPEDGNLIFGNDILKKITDDYPNDFYTRRFKVKEHKVSTVLAANHQSDLKFPLGWIAPSAIKSAAQLFVGYLLLDAVIGNTDRHHENWGWITLSPVTENGVYETYLAPTFDHASSLGRELSDDVREKRLQTRDQGYSIKNYCLKALSAFYDDDFENKPLTTIEAFTRVNRHLRFQKAADYWLHTLEQFDLSKLYNDIFALDDAIISNRSKLFAFEVVQTNIRILLEKR